MRGFDDYSGWFAECCDMYDFCIEEDALATTFLSCGAVLLLMAALETGSARVISSISGLPEEFTAGFSSVLIGRVFEIQNGSRISS
jgi:hypothetical protein